MPGTFASCHGVHERKRFRMQGLASELDTAVALSVSRIADQGMTERVEVDADLVGAAGLETTAHQRRIREALEHFVVGDRGAAARHHRHASALYRVTSDRSVDAAVAGDAPVRDGDVLAAHAARLELSHQFSLGLEGLRHDEEPAGVLVEPMNDSGTR